MTTRKNNGGCIPTSESTSGEESTVKHDYLEAVAQALKLCTQSGEAVYSSKLVTQ